MLLSMLNRIWCQDSCIMEWLRRDVFLRWQLPLLRRKTPLFRHINIQTNNRCTRHCPHCLYGIEKALKPEQMSEDLYDLLLADLVRVNFRGRLSLFEINEPLTDPRIPNFLRRARSQLPKCFLFLMTNGDLLTVEKGEELFAAGLQELYVTSYDSSAAARNEDTCNALRKCCGLVVHEDRSDWSRWVSRAGNLPAYYRGRRSGVCELVFRQLVVKPSGQVVSCAHDLRAKVVLGDASVDPITDIWFSPKFEELRSRLARGDRSGSTLCRECDYEGTGGFIRKNRRSWGR